ncbi:hypothetical protein [Loktanella sp. R86503]|uniref:hypothetical protein n=1 Tax=Loktanella sp. R86503 TaxID=3093847 RepID=UPI0036DBD4B7
MIEGLLVPAIGLGLLGWLVPKLWSMVLPEGLPALAVNAVLSAMVLTALTGLFFVTQYWAAGASWAQWSKLGLLNNMVYFTRLGLAAAIIWGPLMGVSLMGLPRTWVRIKW